MSRCCLLLIACVLGCSAAPRRDRSPDAADGSTLRPAMLQYAGRHEGDHPPWHYHQTVTIRMTERDGRPVWRRTQAFRDDDKVSTTIEADRETLHPVRSELLWNGIAVRLDYAPGRMSGVIEEKGAQRAVEHRIPQPVVLSDLLDLQIAAMPLANGYQTRISLLDFWLLAEPPRLQTRAFVVRVDREDLITTPGGELPVYVVAIEPTDGDDRLKATYHVLTTRPHYAVRMEYIVNPATVGEEKRSVGIDELVSLSVQLPTQ
jgi:hypothetical protein